MTMRPPRLPVRVCSIHGLACGPDGRCVLCQRAGASDGASAEGRWGPLGGIALACALILAGVVYWKRAAQRPALPRDAPPTRVALASPPPEADDPAVDTAALEEKTAKEHERVASEQQRQHVAEAEIKNVRIVMYSTKSCDLCDTARAWLGAERLAFQEIDVGSDPAALAEMHKITPSKQVPVFDVDGEVLVGFGPTNVAGAVQRAAQKRAR